MSKEKEIKKTSALPRFAITCLFLVGGLAVFLGLVQPWGSLVTPLYLLIAALVFGYIVHVCFSKDANP